MPDIDALIAEVAEAMPRHFANATRRMEHSKGVAKSAALLAQIYGASQKEAYLAGLLHDWEKVMSTEELCALSEANQILPGEPREQVGPLLHGPLAAQRLPKEFPGIPQPVLRAIARHTTGAPDMSKLDMCVFVADAIEPLRGHTADPLRDEVGRVSLEELYLDALAMSISFVIQKRKQLWPGALAIYNEIVGE